MKLLTSGGTVFPSKIDSYTFQLIDFLHLRRDPLCTVYLKVLWSPAYWDVWTPLISSNSPSDRLYVGLKHTGLQLYQSRIPIQALPVYRQVMCNILISAKSVSLLVKLELHDIRQVPDKYGAWPHSKCSININITTRARRPSSEVISSDFLILQMGKLRSRGMEGSTQGQIPA